MQPSNIKHLCVAEKVLPENNGRATCFSKRKHFTAILLVVLVLFCGEHALSQKYYFQHWDVSNGLSQSQVLTLCPDQSKQIWLSTFTGVDCFDGRQFKNFNVSNGLTSNVNLAMTCDHKGIMWIGGTRGITALTRSGPVVYPFNFRPFTRSITKIVADGNDQIWVVANFQLFRLDKAKLVVEPVASKNNIVSDICLDGAGNLYAAIYNFGIFKRANNSWQQQCAVKNIFIRSFIIDGIPVASGTFITRHEIFHFTGNEIQKKVLKLSGSLISEYNCLCTDHNRNIWIGTDHGAVLLRGLKTTVFNEGNGFSNMRIFAMCNDADNRMWFGTDGEGVYSYLDGSHLIYDKSQGLNNEVVMGLTRDTHGNVFMATDGGGVWQLLNNKLMPEKLPVSNSSGLRINCIYSDTHDNLWVGTDFNGLWMKPAGSKTYRQVANLNLGTIFYIYEDEQHTIWVGGNNGCSRIVRNTVVPVPSFPHYCTSFTSMGRDSVLVGTAEGLYLIFKGYPVNEPRFKFFANENILTLKRFGSYILVGTNDKGLFILNYRTGAIQNINRSSLGSNILYSVAVKDHELWIGTGTGINRFAIDTAHGKLNLKRMPVLQSRCETNENAILATDSSILFGTSKGAYVFRIKSPPAALTSPKTILEHVSFPQQDKSERNSFYYLNGYRLPADLKLPSDKSHVTINYQAIQFSGDDPLYQYKLEGLDSTYSEPTKTNFVDYPNLPPGKYTFRVKALSGDARVGTPAVFSFIITPTFTQTLFFKLLILLFFLTISYAFYLYKIFAARKKHAYIEALKHREHEIIRKQTAEDFHDDLGNKLTRITMLSELLERRLSKDHYQEEKTMVKQIRMSAQDMYIGTKNIIWALNPENDNLQQVLLQVESFGQDLFPESNIRFETHINLESAGSITLPLGYSRNIILICKELLNNILKHSQATRAAITVTIDKNEIKLVVMDNGIGFDTNQSDEGDGLQNMQKRAAKLNAKLTIDSKKGTGTISTLIMPLP
ncbi:MAG TPA: two-component regulator propeller domain-containing protein [Mucilaginibacter sp.]|nr:two-component regulator propeller domain-containing protein [Mucilaginibacter sp.]